VGVERGPEDGVNREILIHREDIAQRVRQLGKKISEDYEGKKPIIVGILKGSIVFLSDLIRELDPNLQPQIDFMEVSSYSGTESSRAPKIGKDLTIDITGKHVLVVEDIVDTGYSFDTLLGILSARNPASLKTCALISKPDSREVEVPINYLGFAVGDVWIVGYGMDTDQLGRNLPDIWQRVTDVS
jgi:hypoxanthine phosphoribosyltransferase